MRPVRHSRAAHSWPALLGILLCGAVAPGRADATLPVFAEIQFGKRFPSRADLTLRQAERDTRLRVSGVLLRDESFDDPLWYSVRVGLTVDRPRGIDLALELVHAKLYADLSEVRRVRGRLRGAPVDARMPLREVVQQFAVSHGENHLLLEARIRRGLASFAQGYAGAGFGPVIAHPENRVDGVPNRRRYEWGGSSVCGLLGIRLVPPGPAAILLEYRLTRASLDVSIGGGSARLVEISHHLSFGIGFGGSSPARCRLERRRLYL